MSLIVLFNLTAFRVVWEQIKKEKQERQKNTETNNTIMNRIFGIDQDPTDEGHLVETEKKFQKINEKLDKIAEMQEEAKEERRREHREVRYSINSIIEELSEEEGMELEDEKL